MTVNGDLEASVLENMPELKYSIDLMIQQISVYVNTHGKSLM
jgi:hypothetical protein